MKVSSDGRQEKKRSETGPRRRIRYTRAIAVARDSIGTLLQAGSLFFISLIRAHLNNIALRERSHEGSHRRDPGLRGFRDRPRTRFLLLRGTCASTARGATPRETVFHATPSASPAVHPSHVPSPRAGPRAFSLSLDRARFSNFSFGRCVLFSRNNLYPRTIIKRNAVFRGREGGRL